MSLKLNIGAGSTVIEGFTPIDRRLGMEAYPLTYADNSADEIRASHILEHFSFRDAPKVIAEWVRVLKPGGKIRIAVPDFDKCVDLSKHDRLWRYYIMGGQTDENDFHRSLWTVDSLRMVMESAGLGNIQHWQSSNTDCAAMPCSLNLEGIKAVAPQQQVKVCAVMSIPRVGWNDAWGQVLEALSPLRIPVHRFTGVFWGQCMQRVFNECVQTGVDWILTIDYDSMFTAQHVDQLLGTLGNNPHIDALAAMQIRRGQKYPLITKSGATKKIMPCPGCGKDMESLVAEIDNSPLRVTTAHFGLTLIRVDALKAVPKPWFYSQPDENCEWEPDGSKLDDDIWFWHQWKAAGKTVFVDPNCRIGHLELMVAEMGDNMEPRHIYVPEWRAQNGYAKQESKHDSQVDPPLGQSFGGGGDNGTGQRSGEFDPARRVPACFHVEDAAGNSDGSAERNGHVAESVAETSGSAT